MALPVKDVEIVMDLIDWNLDHFEDAITTLLLQHPYADRKAVEEQVMESFMYRFEQTSPSKSKRSKETTVKLLIPPQDVEDVLGSLEMNDMVDYLYEIVLKDHPNATREEIEEELRTVYGLGCPTTSTNRRRTGSRKENKEGNKLRKKTTISYEDVMEGVEFFGFVFEPSLRENLINHFHYKYPHLSRENIRKQLESYELGDSTASTSHRTPRKSFQGTPRRSSQGTPQWPPHRTPPPKGSAYEPSDFSPSIYGACSKEMVDWLREKRAKHLPHYVTPSRAPRTIRQRRLSFTKRTSSKDDNATS